MKHIFIFLSILLVLSTFSGVMAQITKPSVQLGGQLRTRTEFRNGYGTLPSPGTEPAIFTSQRTRLNVGLSGVNYKIFISLQDVRVWGQDVSTINRTNTISNNGLMFHQAWAEMRLADSNSFLNNFTLKVGRQEFAYDDQRLLGNLDWLQQGRRHDAVLLMFNPKKIQIHLGAAFNQNKESSYGTSYMGNPTEDPSFIKGYPISTNGLKNMYKSLQYIYLTPTLPKHHVSLLILKDDFQKYSIDSVIRFEDGVWNRYTMGLFSKIKFKSQSSVTGSVFYQTGKTPMEGASLSAAFASIYTDFKIRNQFSIGPGIDYSSGNSTSTNSTVSHAFDPLYGTPHKFWGNLDYFYAGTPMLPTGLTDIYLRTSFNKNKFTISLNIHEFYTPSTLFYNGNKLNNRLGTEADVDVNYQVSSAVSIHGGYSLIKGTSTLKHIKSALNAKSTGQYAYLMLNFKPF